MNKTECYIIPDETYVSRSKGYPKSLVWGAGETPRTHFLIPEEIHLYLGPIGTYYIPITETIQLTIFVPNEEGFEGQFQDLSPDEILPGGALVDLISEGNIKRPYSISSHYRASLFHPDGSQLKGDIYVLYIRNVEGKQTKFLREYLVSRSLQVKESDNFHFLRIARDTLEPCEHLEVNKDPYQMFPVNESLIIHRKSSWDPKPEFARIPHKSFYSTGTGIAPFLLYLQNIAEFWYRISDVSGPSAIPSMAVPLEIVHSVKYLEELPPDTNGLAILSTFKVGYTYHLIHAWSQLVRYIRATYGEDFLSLDEYKLKILFTRIEQDEDIVMYPFEPVEGIEYIFQEKGSNELIYSQDLLRERLKSGRTDDKIYACGYGEMLRAVGSVSQEEFGRPHYLFAYEAFTA